MGLDHRVVEDKLPGIVEYAELGEFIDVPIKTYSSGMRARLGFAIATSVEPDILILDEVLVDGRRRVPREVQAAGRRAAPGGEGDRARDPRHELGQGVLHPRDPARAGPDRGAGLARGGGRAPPGAVRRSAAPRPRPRACSRTPARSGSAGRPAPGGASAASERLARPPAAQRRSRTRSRPRRPGRTRRPAARAPRQSSSGRTSPSTFAAISTSTADGRVNRTCWAIDRSRDRLLDDRPRGRRRCRRRPGSRVTSPASAAPDAPELHADAVRPRRADRRPTGRTPRSASSAPIAAQADLDRVRRQLADAAAARRAGSWRRAGRSARRARGREPGGGAGGGRRCGLGLRPRARRPPARRRPRTRVARRCGRLGDAGAGLGGSAAALVVRRLRFLGAGVSSLMGLTSRWAGRARRQPTPRRVP